jgi:hypothetical protein
MARKADKRAPQPSKQGSVRAASAVVLLILVAAASAITLLYEELAPAAGRPLDAAVSNETRFAQMRSALGPGARLGYVSDIGGDDLNTNGAYFLARYSLAPALVEPGAGRPLVVGNFQSPASIPSALAKHKLRVVRDFQNGVLLLERTD